MRYPSAGLFLQPAHCPTWFPWNKLLYRIRAEAASACSTPTSAAEQPTKLLLAMEAVALRMSK